MVVSIYQAGESLYELFDKVCVINEGRMAYFGPADRARQYFIDMGYEPANRQTTADFLVAGECTLIVHISSSQSNLAYFCSHGSKRTYRSIWIRISCATQRHRVRRLLQKVRHCTTKSGRYGVVPQRIRGTASTLIGLQGELPCGTCEDYAAFEPVYHLNPYAGESVDAPQDTDHQGCHRGSSRCTGVGDVCL